MGMDNRPGMFLQTKPAATNPAIKKNQVYTCLLEKLITCNNSNSGIVIVTIWQALERFNIITKKRNKIPNFLVFDLKAY